jgi:hypothetical protein
MPFHVGWHLVIWVLLIRITWECRMTPPDPDLYRGEGHLALSGPIERYFALAGYHPGTVMQTPLTS